MLFGQRELRDHPNALMICGDPSDPGTILNGEAAEFLDLSEPCAVLLPGVLDLIPELAAPWWVVARIASYLAPGSWMVATHLTQPQAGEDRDAQNLLCSLWTTLGAGLFPARQRSSPTGSVRCPNWPPRSARQSGFGRTPKTDHCPPRRARNFSASPPGYRLAPAGRYGIPELPPPPTAAGLRRHP
ncbi:SAM-dependent methyltransferase [Actinoplanes sp. ATCC 53533]|uniref:SAM-dependent methyltransferase n=1 Tax=Actinoplanes sp. ATCC 53533 TaxID=1288362 RepID=UPI001315391B|nr:SAM-dependent methyltransferase [Actinoplanes sp. ATCC 53533]